MLIIICLPMGEVFESLSFFLLCKIFFFLLRLTLILCSVFEELILSLLLSVYRRYLCLSFKNNNKMNNKMILSLFFLQRNSAFCSRCFPLDANYFSYSFLVLIPSPNVKNVTFDNWVSCFGFSCFGFFLRFVSLFFFLLIDLCNYLSRVLVFLVLGGTLGERIPQFLLRGGP